MRWNYIRWIQDLLDTTSDSYTDRYDHDRQVVGLDIGVGASAIYPLLATSTRPAWRMAATDVDQHSFGYAKRNVEANGLSKRIRLALTTPESPLLPLQQLGLEELDFVMTNPPFYSSDEDMRTSYTGKSAAPSAVCTGAENEMICPGGDVGFVSRILDESLVLREKVQWYTAMFGKLGSLQQVIALLKEKGVANWAVTTLQAGKRTKRWAVAWSFQGWRARNDVARRGDLVLGVLPTATAHTVAVEGMGKEELGNRLDDAMRDFDLKWRWRANLRVGIMQAERNVWSRVARRKKKYKPTTTGTTENGDESDSDHDDRIALAARLEVSDGNVEVRWLRGQDHVVFESFCGMLKRTLATRDTR